MPSSHASRVSPSSASNRRLRRRTRAAPVADLEDVPGGSRRIPWKSVRGPARSGCHRGVEARHVEPGIDDPAGEDRLGLRAEGQPPPSDGVDDRLHPDDVAHDEELVEAAIEQCEREDPVEATSEADALVLVEVGQQLRVARGRETVSTPQHVLPQLWVV